MESNREVKVRMGLTPKALVVAILGMILTALVLFNDNYNQGFRVDLLHTPANPNAYQYWFLNGIWTTFGMAFLVLLVIALINGRGGIRFSRQEVALIAIVIPLGALYLGAYHAPFGEWFTEGIWVAKQPAARQKAYWDLMPDLVYGPKDGSFYKFAIGEPGAAIKPKTLMIPWDGLAPMMAIAIFYTLGGMLCLTFASMLLRRLYIRTEFLAMPTAEIMTGFVDLTQPGSEKPKLFKSKIFLAFFLLSFAYTFILWHMTNWATLINRAPTGWLKGYIPGTAIYFWPAWDLTRLALLQWVPLNISLTPWEIGWALILPTNVQLSTFIGYLAMSVFFPLIYNSQTGAWGVMATGRAAVNVGPVLGPMRNSSEGFSLIAISMGLCIAMLVTPLVMNWREVSPIFKALVKEPDPSFDPDKPLSYRLTWLITLGSGLIWYLMGTAVMRIDWLALLTFLLVMSVLFLGQGRIIAETGGFYGLWEGAPYLAEGGLVSAASLQFAGVMPTKNVQITNISSYYFLHTRGTAYGWGGRMPWYGLHSMKVSDQTKTRSRDTLVILSLGIIFSLIAIAVLTFFFKAYSASIAGARGEYHTAAATRVGPGSISWFGSCLTAENVPKTIAQVVLGFAAIFVLALLQPRVSLLRPLSLGGLAFGAVWGAWIWAPFLAAFIIKHIVLKTKGIVFYENIIKPMALGLIAGAFISSAFGGIGNFFVQMAQPFV